MKLICDVCACTEVSLSAQTIWDYDNNTWKGSKGQEWITFEVQNNKLVEIDRMGFVGLTQQEVIDFVNSNMVDFVIDFGCAECEEIVNPSLRSEIDDFGDDFTEESLKSSYINITNEIEIFNKLTE